LQEQVARAGGEFIPAHVSGPAYIADIADIVRFVTAVTARRVVPIHTFEPQLFEDHFPNVTRLADGTPFDLSWSSAGRVERVKRSDTNSPRESLTMTKTFADGLLILAFCWAQEPRQIKLPESGLALHHVTP
jgi:hypothetical protein